MSKPTWPELVIGSIQVGFLILARHAPLRVPRAYTAQNCANRRVSTAAGAVSGIVRRV